MGRCHARANLQRVVNNSRFLILPWVRVQNLASRVLSLMARQLPCEWHSRYGVEPLLLETLVDHSRYRGTCYRAANWIELGVTTGRGADGPRAPSSRRKLENGAGLASGEGPSPGVAGELRDGTFCVRTVRRDVRDVEDDLESIIAFLRSAESRQMSHSDVEKLVRERSYELSRKLFQAMSTRAVPARRRLRSEVRMEWKGTRSESTSAGLTTIFGEIRVKRFGYGAEGADSLHPLDAELNLPRERYSFELRRTAAVEVSKGAFDEAVASLGRHTGAKVGKRQVEELAGRAAEDFDAFYGQRAPPAGDRSASVLAITADGKGVVMLRKDLREATKKAAEKGSRRLGKRLTKGEKRNRKRMATVAAVYTVEPLRAPTRRRGSCAGTKRRARERQTASPQDKRVWASLAKEPEEVLEEAFAEAERRDPSHRKSWVALVDGNATQLKILHKLAGQHHVELTIVLDFIHVCEYVWKASLGFYEETEPARQVWVQERLLRILRGEACLVAAGIRRSATRRKLTPDNRENVDQCADYLLNHASYLHYDECLAAGFPIATGVIEGACRHLVSDRMDLTGARWSLAGAEAVLRLRALRSSGDFDEYWRFHEQCEYERNHASRYADGKVVPVKGRHLKRVK